MTCHQAPHKPFVLLSVMDLVAEGALTENFIPPSMELVELFNIYWFSIMPVGKKVIMRVIPRWKELINEFGFEEGTAKWVAEEEERYHCPDCGNKLFRGAKRCNACKIPVDVD